MKLFRLALAAATLAGALSAQSLIIPTNGRIRCPPHEVLIATSPTLGTCVQLGFSDLLAGSLPVHATTHAAAGSDPVTPSAIGAEASANKGAASGYAGLDSGTKVLSAVLPFPGSSAKGGILTTLCGGGQAANGYQTDGTPNCVALGTGSGDPSGYTTVTYAATPVFPITKNTGQTLLMNLSGNVTSSTTDTSGVTSSGRPVVTFRLCDAGGGHTFVWPTTVLNHGTVDGTAGSCSVQTFVWDGSNFQALGNLLVTGLASDAIAFPGSTSGVTYVQALAVAGGRLSFPNATDTLVARATTDVFTNKTFDSAGTGNSLKVNGTALTNVSGTGDVCLSSGSACAAGGSGFQTFRGFCDGQVYISGPGADGVSLVGLGADVNTACGTGSDDVKWGAPATLTGHIQNLYMVSATNDTTTACTVYDESTPTLAICTFGGGTPSTCHYAGPTAAAVTAGHRLWIQCAVPGSVGGADLSVAFQLQ